MKENNKVKEMNVMKGSNNKVPQTEKEKINVFEEYFALILKIPGIKIDRNNFLISTFNKQDPNKIKKLITATPKQIGIPQEEISKVATKIITTHSIFTTTSAFLAGLPGGFSLIGTIPADILQFSINLFLCVQKLLYLYGWKSFTQDDLLLKKTFVSTFAIMLEIDGAEKTLLKLRKIINSRFFKIKYKSKILSKFKFTSKLLLYKPYKQLVIRIIRVFSKKQVTKLGAKVVPFVGGFVNGHITYTDFNRMTGLLKTFLDKNYK